MHRSDSQIKKIFVIMAAGIGSRMKLTYPKQFLEYKGKPLFVHPLMMADASHNIDEIVIVTNDDNIQRVKDICNDLPLVHPVSIISGGKERQDSVYNAINHVSADADDIIFIQDGVRPFLKSRYIDEIIDVITGDTSLDGAIIGVKAKDTIKIIDDDGIITSTPTRQYVVAAQTPQAFRYGTIANAMDKAYAEGFYGTDDAMLVERLGGKVKVIFGDYDNIKVTTPEDLKYLES